MSRSQIKVGAVLSYIAVFLNIAISFFYTPWMIRMIGVSDYGLYSLVISFISYFILDLGLTQSVERFIAKYRAEGNDEAVENLLGLITKVFLLIDIIIFVLLVIIYFFLGQIFTGLTPEEIEKLKVLYCISGAFSILSFMFKPLGGTIMAYELFIQAKWIDMFGKVGTVILVCVALLLGADVYALVLINGAIALLASVLKYVVFRKETKLKINIKYSSRDELKSVFSFSAWAFGNGLAQRMRLTLIPTLLGILSNSTEISIFSLGMTMEAMIFTISAAINGLFLPRVSVLTHQGDIGAIHQLMVRVGRLQLYLITLIITGFVIFGHSFINLWVGPDFANTYYVLICLVFTNVITLTQRIADDYIFALNKIKGSSSRLFLSSLVGLILSAFLAPKYGAVGCGIGTGAGLLFYTILINFYYKQELQLNILDFFKECHGKILPLLVLLFIIGLIIFSKFPLQTWGGLLVSILAYVVAFGLVSFFFLFNNEEKSLVKSVLKR